MENTAADAILTTLCVVGVILFLFWLIYQHGRDERAEGYKQGQADAIKGEIKVTLVEFKDGERGWYYEDELKDLKEYKTVEK